MYYECVCGGKACINALVPSNNLQYADNTVLLAHTEEDLQPLLNELNISGHFGMEINSKKTEVMIFTKQVNSGARLCNIT